MNSEKKVSAFAPGALEPNVCGWNRIRRRSQDAEPIAVAVCKNTRLWLACRLAIFISVVFVATVCLISAITLAADSARPTDDALQAGLIGTWQVFYSTTPDAVYSESTYNVDGSTTTIVTGITGLFTVRARWKIANGVLYLSNFEGDTTWLRSPRDTKRHEIVRLTAEELTIRNLATGFELHQRRKHGTKELQPPSVFLDSLRALVAVTAIPIAMLVITALLAWRYRRTLARAMMRVTVDSNIAATATPANSISPALNLSVRYFEPQTVTYANTLFENTTTKVRRLTAGVAYAYIAAVLVYIVLTNVVYASVVNVPLDVRLVTAYLLLVPEFFIVLSFLGTRVLYWLAILLLYLLIGVLLALAFLELPRGILMAGVLAQLFIIFPVAALFLLSTRRARHVLTCLMAILLFLIIEAIFGALLLRLYDLYLPDAMSLWLKGFGYLFLVAAVAVFYWLLHRRSLAAPVVTLLALAVLGITIDALQPSLYRGHILWSVPVNVLHLFVLWIIFKLLISLQDRQLLPAELLQSHVCWGFLTLYLIYPAFFGSPSFWEVASFRWILLLVLFVLAFLLYVVILHFRLRQLWARTSAEPGKRLLLLRVFGKPQKREQLLDMLANTWRRVGRIDVITGTDVAMHTLTGLMLEAFLLRRVDDQFLKTNSEVDGRLERLKFLFERDIRYPVNCVNCYANAWRRAIARLAPVSDAVLMDLRGFTRENQGCIFELEFIVRHVSLARIILLIDRTTDVQMLESVVQAAWIHLPTDSPNTGNTQPMLNALRFEKATRDAARALFSLLVCASHSHMLNNASVVVSPMNEEAVRSGANRLKSASGPGRSPAEF